MPTDAGTLVAKKAKKAGRPKAPAHEPLESVRFRCTPAFKLWLQEYANDRMLTMTDVVIQAIIEDAARRGFKPHPKD